MSDAAKTPTPEQHLRRLTRRSFALGAASALAGLAGWGWLTTATREDGLPWPLRRALRFNQWLAQGSFSPARLAPTFPDEAVQGLARVNGMVGLHGEVDAGAWQVLLRHDGRADRSLRLHELRQVPRTDLVTELKCVEGWSQVMHFGGYGFRDFLSRFGLGTRSGRVPDPEGAPHDLYRYVYLATPDESYYVGLDMASALHPQTLLCDMMNWQPLSRQHGAPLRLYLTVKYGYKSLKRVSLIRFQDERPPDYWADRGYDWYAGL
jgi:DMSO/TMAO reductase YedYZ molybdopterin-dependent catalytic subunit